MRLKQYLNEKFLTAFKKYGHYLELFENPSMKEFRDMKGSFRFILDSKRKKIYVWTSSGAVHGDAWVEIKKTLNDSRPLYKSETLLTGTMDTSGIHFYGAAGIPPKVRKSLREEDWSFAKNYLDMNKLQDVLSRL